MVDIERHHHGGGSTDDAIALHETKEPRIETAVTVVAHDEVLAVRNDHRPKSLRAGLLRPCHHRVRLASHRLYREQVLPLIECRQLLAHGRLKWFITSRFTVD